MAKITFQDDKIYVKDKNKNAMRMIYFLLGINLFNSTLFLLGSDKPLNHWLNILWFLVGGTSIVGFLLQIKRTSANEICREDIVDIKSKQYFNIYKLNISLKNGKLRSIIFQSEAELKAAIKFFIKNNYEVN